MANKKISERPTSATAPKEEPIQEGVYEYDLEGWKEAQTLVTALDANISDKISDFEEYEEIYYMDWNSGSADPDVKTTISPDGHDKVKGAVRLLTATSPSWEVPRKSNARKSDKISDTLEKAANLMWLRSNAIAQLKTEKEMAFSGFLYDEIHLELVSTADIVTNMKDALSKAETPAAKATWKGRLKKAERINEMTPILFECLYPGSAEAVRGRTGLDYYYQKVKKKVADVLAEWGGRVDDLLQTMKPDEWVTIKSLWGDTYRYVWIDEKMDHPVYAEPHGLSFIPVVAVRPEGSRLTTNAKREHEPMLYGAVKSGVYDRENTILTVAFTNAAALLNATFHFQQGQKDDTFRLDTSKVGGVVVTPPGSNLKPLAKEMINPDVIQLLTLAKQFMDQTTMYSQALGLAPEGAGNFSYTSLVAQQGRLPLVAVKEAMAIALNTAMQLAFRWIKEAGGKTKITNRTQESLEINPDDIPNLLEFDVKVEVDLPQDKLQAGNLATMLAKGPDPLVSKAWVRSNVLQIGQSDDEQRQIWYEGASLARYQTDLTMLMERLKAKMAAMQQAQEMERAKAQGQGQPGGGQVPGGEQPGPNGPAPSPEEQAMAAAAGAGQPSQPGPGLEGQGQGGLPSVQAGALPAIAPGGMTPPGAPQGGGD